jgi:hypothetical protein
MGDLANSRSNTELCEVLTCLPEKFVVDFANGIDVARDHIRVQQDRTGYFARLFDGFSGQTARRQAEINASLTDGVEGALTWLTELTESLAKSNFALAKVNERVATIYGAVTTLADYSSDTRSRLAELSRSLNSRIDEISCEIARVAFEQRAERQLEQVFNKWAAGRFGAFSCAGRCYLVLEELRWGVFGDFCRNSKGSRVRDEFLDDLTNRAIRQLVADKRSPETQGRAPVDEWIAFPPSKTSIPDAPEALAYMGDWSEPERHPFVFTTSQFPQSLPVAVPRLWSTERLAEALVSEVFERE